MKTKEFGMLGVKLAVSALLVWFVLTKVDFADIAARLRTADLRWLAGSLCVGPACILLAALRWRILSLGLLEYRDAVKYTWIGLFFGSILPGVVGGDVAKGVSMAVRIKGTRDPRLPVSIAMDKLVGFWALLLLFAVVAVPLMVTQPQLLGNSRAAVWVALALTGAGVIGAAALIHPRGAEFASHLGQRLPFAPLRDLAGKMIGAVGSYSGKGRVLVQAVLISLLLHALSSLALWLVLRSLGVPASPTFAAVFYPMLSCLLALPVSISGIGVRDVFAVGMFSAFGLDPEAAVAFSWLLLGLSIPNALIGGAIQLWEMFARRAAD